MIKKFFKWLGILLLVIIGIALAAPLLFKNKIVALVKKEINKNVTAKVDFTNVDISFFRRFPRVAVALEDLQVLGTDGFATDTLLSARRLDASMDIMSIIRGNNMNIYSVVATSPRIHAIVSKTGLVNWDILKADTVATVAEAKPFNMQLDNYVINNGYISYRDEPGGITSEIININHQGSGDFTADSFLLKTTTTADAVSVTYGGVAYLSQVKAAINGDIAINNKESIYRFATDQISINELKLSAKGIVQAIAKEGYNLDIAFSSPSNKFKNFLSLVPSIYQRDFDKITTSGAAVFNGFVKGLYTKDQFPAYQVDLKVKNGFFQYPDLPRPLQQINFSLQVDNPNGDPDNTVLTIDSAHFKIDNDPFDFRLMLVKPTTNMFVDGAARGRLDLSKIAQLIKLDAGTTIGGLLNADVNMKGNVADIEKQQYDKFSAGGTVSLANFVYVAKDYPSGVKINNLLTTFTPARIDISNLSGQYMGTNFLGSGQINNGLSYVLKNQPLAAVLNLTADNVNLNDWMGVAADTTSAKSVSTPFVVPANLDVTVNAKVDKLLYDQLTIQNLVGKLQVKEQAVVVSDIKGNALDGQITINGVYDTRVNPLKPDIAFEYDVRGVDVQKTFYAFNTVQTLMPIGKFIAGRLNSHLTVNGRLGENMMPDLSTLTGEGNLLLIEGFLSKFAPLEKIATTLNVKALEQISVREVKNYFEFSNGKVLVKPFNLSVGGIDMEIGGLQGFDQSLNYMVNMKLPRSLMGTKGNQLVNTLVTQINSKGVPVTLGETVNLSLQLGGFFNNPTVKTDLKQRAASLTEQLKQDATDFAKAKIDSTKNAVTNAVKDTMTSLKNQAVNAAKDELAKRLLGSSNNVVDSTTPKIAPKKTVKGLMDNILRKKPKDSIR